MSPHPHDGEFGLIAWIRARATQRGRTLLGIGDDCAILRGEPSADWLVTTDMLMDGRHFRAESDPGEAIGHKALAVNLSDIAAMAGIPVAAVVAVALPRATAVPLARAIHAGMRPLADRFGVDLVGGDTNAWEGPLVISVTLLGVASGRGPVRRSGAVAGDRILVTGPLGGSLLGRHLRPEPRIAEALALNELASIHAMIDLSDGLSSDLGHILEESGGLGATLDAGSIPIHDDAVESSLRDRQTPLRHALDDGEDFELCLVVSRADADRLLARPPAALTLHDVGEIDEVPGLRLRSEAGTVGPLEALGFDHLR